MKKTKSPQAIIKRELMQAKTTYFIMSIDLYCSNYPKFRSNKAVFSKEFTDNPVLLEAIETLESTFTTKEFCKFMNDTVKEVILKKVKSDSTSYQYLSEIAYLADASLLRNLALAENATAKQKFTYLFKQIEDMYLVPQAIHTFPTKNKRGRVRNEYLKLAITPQNYILNLLEYPFEDFTLQKRSYRLTDQYVINSLIRSFKNK